MSSSCDVKINDDTVQNTYISRSQRTIAGSVSLEGRGLFSGVTVTMSFHPAPSNSGVMFKRVDLDAAPVVAASVDNLVGTPRCTILGSGIALVQGVEHVLSAFKALNIDNVIVELNAAEIPVGDGSALSFVEMIDQAGIVEQDSLISPVAITQVFHWSRGDVCLVALPADEFRVSYTLSYPEHPLLHAQFYSYAMDEESYRRDIAASRTFSLYEEIKVLLEKGMIKGGSLDNGVVVRGSEVMNPEGLRFPDEMVRHKILDLIGDISLIGVPLLAHFIAIRSGHHSNTSFARDIFRAIKQDRGA